MPKKATQAAKATPVTEAPATAQAPAQGDDFAAKRQAAVIAELMASGLSYARAVAMVEGKDEGPPASADAALSQTPQANEPSPDDVIAQIVDPGEDLEVYEVPNDLEDQDAETMYELLHQIRESIEKSGTRRKFQVTVTFDQRVFDWVLYAAIVEAYDRRRPELSVADYMVIKIKEQMAADPTNGGRRSGGGSGLKDMWNPQKGSWG